ncbi:MAG: hypothetical protein LC792_03800 [Actinobacteria bacterium]|nr:hypothetical protein [Actinomycetota bacterium]
MRIGKPRTRRPPTAVPTQRSLHDVDLIDESEALLDDIDASLEETLVTASYIQRGGE